MVQSNTQKLSLIMMLRYYILHFLQPKRCQVRHIAQVLHCQMQSPTCWHVMGGIHADFSCVQSAPYSKLPVKGKQPNENEP